MTDVLYNVIFSGEIVEGKDLKEVKDNLVELFKTDINKIDAIFKEKGSVVRRNLDFITALKYVKAMEKAGAVCLMQTNEPEPSHEGDSPQIKRPKVISLQPVPVKLACSPLPCSRITGWSEGIDLNRKDIQKIYYQDIISVSIFESQKKCSLLFFIKKNRRSFVCESNLIVYTDFPQVAGTNLVTSLRNFLTFLCSKNEKITIDENTYGFMSGRAQESFGKDIVELATALTTELYSNSLLSHSSETTDELSVKRQTETSVKPSFAEKSVREADKTVAKQTYPLAECPKCGTRRFTTQQECSRCGLIFEKWEARHKDLSE